MASEKPEVLDLLQELGRDFQARFGTWFVGGVALGGIQLGLTIASVVFMYAAMIGGMVVGISAGDEDLMSLGMLGGAFLGISIMIVANLGVLTPMQASLTRALVDHLEGGPELTISSPFATATQDLPKVYGYVLLNMLAVVVLMPFCYLPALVFIFFTTFAWFRVVLEGEGPVTAILWSIGHVKEDIPWHLAFAGLLFAMLFILQYIPIVGPLLAPSVTMGWGVYAYRRSVHGTAALTA
ncbi:MAG: hypothetical protein KC656_04280 [Myxococcales bacterium]|nr:hypothetical protein [Myxococcales bacterium]MCB9668358.1 hypothetical protein [Alphaproteobacteria bacterium]